MTKNLSINYIEIVNEYLLIAWNGGEESMIMLKALRDNCPCAHCSGEVDALGNIYIGPHKQLKDENYILRSIDQVGHYALKPNWQDGHKNGLYTYKLLKHIANFGAEK